MPFETFEESVEGSQPIELHQFALASDTFNYHNQDDAEFVLGADTVVACGRRMLGKATDESQARAFLKLLSGRRHRVHGGICVIDPEGAAHRRLVTTQVAFKRLSRDEIDAYIEGGEWRDKAGAYAIQGAAAAFVPKINGSYSNVVGLALSETAALLHGAGFNSG